MPDFLSEEFKRKLLEGNVEEITAKVVYPEFEIDLAQEESDGVRRLFSMLCPLMDILTHEAELRKWNQARKELLADPETAKEYEELRQQYEVISQINQITKKAKRSVVSTWQRSVISLRFPKISHSPRFQIHAMIGAIPCCHPAVVISRFVVTRRYEMCRKIYRKMYQCQAAICQ